MEPCLHDPGRPALQHWDSKPEIPSLSSKNRCKTMEDARTVAHLLQPRTPAATCLEALAARQHGITTVLLAS